jgi:DNA-binding transcriptional LysR family regulator
MAGQINIRQLEAFYWIMRLGGFGAAGEKLGATQPAISARIKGLEESLGTTLFLRGGKVPAPSAAARALYPLAVEALAIMARIAGEIAPGENIGGIVRIGMGEIVALSWFPKFLARLNAAYPSIRLEIHMDVTAHLQRMLDEGQLDLALMVTPGAPALHAESLGSTPMRWMAAPSLVPSEAGLSPRELAELPVYTLSRNSHLHARTIKWFRQHNVRPRLVHSCNNLGVIMKLVRIGCGIALMPPILVADELRRGSLRIVAPAAAGDVTEFFLVRHPDVVDPAILKISEIAARTSVFDARISGAAGAGESRP